MVCYQSLDRTTFMAVSAVLYYDAACGPSATYSNVEPLQCGRWRARCTSYPDPSTALVAALMNTKY